MISAGRLVAIVSPDSAPIKRMVQEARDRGTLIDATYGRRTRSVLIMDNDHLLYLAGNLIFVLYDVGLSRLIALVMARMPGRRR